MAYPCQICHITRERIDDHMARPIYIGKINDICRPTDEQFIQRQRESRIQCCNYAEDLNGLFRPDDDRAALFSSSFLSSYGSSNLPQRPSVESFSRIRWALVGNTNSPLSADRPGLKIDGDESPCPVLFPICLRCTRLARNYLHHRYIAKPPKDPAALYGYDLLYAALLARFLSRNQGVDHPTSLYCHKDTDEVEMLGRAIVVRSGGVDSHEAIEVSGDIFSQIPSLPKWIMSKFEPIAETGMEETELNLAKARQGNPSGPFLTMPQELLEQITWNLDRPTVFALRLTHSHFAMSLPLDQEFWCNELLYGEPPLFGFEPLIDNHASRHPGEYLGRIDALSEVGAHFTKPRSHSMFSEAQAPAKQLRDAMKANKRCWRGFDWKGLVKLLSTGIEFEKGGKCDDAPPGFLYRRRLWAALDKLVNSYTGS